MLKRTPLFATHQKLGGKLIEFGGWEMPVQYSSIVDEHLAVRRAGGMFDISHMGEFFVSGAGAQSFLNQTLTNDVRKMEVGQGQYTLMCYEKGGVVDDLYVYRIGLEQFLLIVNASRIEVDLAWLATRQRVWSGADFTIENASEAFGAIAAQGPRVRSFIDGCFSPAFNGGAVRKPSELKKNEIGMGEWAGQTIYIGCTGYTGEDGFEVVAPSELIEEVWNKLLTSGHAHCVQPAGLGARDTLRTEMCYPLYGHELDERTTPIEAGLSYFVALEKGDFVGRSVLAEQKAKGALRKCAAFTMAGKSAPPRPGYAIWSTGSDAKEIGRVVSGTQSPSLGMGIGLGYVPVEFAKAGTSIEIEIRGRRSPAVVVQKPIYRRS